MSHARAAWRLDEAEICRLFLDGQTRVQIAEATGASLTGVDGVLRRKGLHIKRQDKRRAMPINAVLARPTWKAPFNPARDPVPEKYRAMFGIGR